MTLELERERVVQELCAAYAHDHLSTGELESRLERVYVSVDPQQLRTLLDGLPAASLPTPRSARPATPTASAPAPVPGRAVAANERRYLAVFSQVRRDGPWTPSASIRGRAIFGGIHLDLREASIPAGGIDIDLEVIMGDARITLPPGVGADVDCTALMASVEDKSRPAFPGAPIVRIRGGAIMASILVVTKVPRAERVESWRRQLREWFGVLDDHI